MGQDEPCFERGELRRIAAKRESAHTVAIGAAFLTLVGLSLHHLTPLPLLIAAIADVLAFLFWIRFVNARCPRCDGPFFSVWWILFVGALAQGQMPKLPRPSHRWCIRRHWRRCPIAARRILTRRHLSDCFS